MTPVNRTPEDVKSESSEGRIRRSGVFIGIVKDNVDAQRMGRLSVFIPDFGGDPETKENWYTVGYASPFAGATNVNNNTANSKEMAGSQTSYGFWAVPPDLDNQVLCAFVNGDTARGYWFACLYQQFMNHMVPAVALNLSTKDDINSKNLPPVVEYNKKDTSQPIFDPKRPIFEPLHNSLVKQGLYNDPERGPSTTSARRETPSKVLGLISPRSNSISIDDDPDNECIRFRTRSGVQLLIHETTGYIYMISKEGNSWFELSDEGINMYSKKSISIRSEENVNIHADQNVVKHAGGAIHHTASNITQRSKGKIQTKADGDITRRSPKIKDNSASTDGSPAADGTPSANPQSNGQGQGTTSGAGHQSPNINSLDDAKQYTDQYQVGKNRECASLTHALAPDLGGTPTWRAGGDNIVDTRVPIGTPVATFNYNSDGSYNPGGGTLYAPPGSTGVSGQSHTGIVAGYAADGSPMILDQFNGSKGAPSIRTYSINGVGPEKSGYNYRPIR